MVPQFKIRSVSAVFSIFMLAVCLTYKPVRAAETVEDLLTRADSLRVSQPEVSRTILAELQSLTLSSEQRDYLQYLKGFHAAVDLRIATAIEIIEPITIKHPNDQLGLRSRATLLSLYFGVKDWSDGLFLANELGQLLLKLPRNNDWYTANLGVATYYINLKMYQEGLQVLQRVAASELQESGGDMQCRYSGQHFRAIKGLAIDQVTSAWLSRLEKDCSSLPVSMYSLEPFISWAQYLFESGQYSAVLPVVRRYEQAIVDINYYYFWVALKNSEAEALFALGRIDEAEAVVDDILSRPELSDYSEGYVISTSLKAKILEIREEFEQAYYWQSLAIESEKQQNRLAVTQQLAINRAQAMLKSTEDEMTLLSSNRALLANRVERAKQNIISSYLLIALLCTLLFMAFYGAYKLIKQHRLLTRLATQDPLTGLDNRRQFMQGMQAKLAGSGLAEPVSLIMFDLDNLKWINDHFGHQTGDWVLIQVGKAVKNALDDSTLCCARVGGEEFVLCLAGTDVIRALDYCNVLQRAFAGINTEHRLNGQVISASFGVCDSSQVGKQISALFSGADLAMYQAKKTGRARAVVYQVNAIRKEEVI